MRFVRIRLVLLPLLIGWALVTARAGGAAGTATQVTVFDAVVTKGSFVDKPPKGDSVGDTQKASGILLDPSGARVGTFSYTCVWASVVNGRVKENCTGSATTADGRIDYAGIGRPELDNLVWHVTGGTGAAAGARGPVAIHNVNGPKGTTDSVVITTVTAAHQFKVGVVPRPPANTAFISRADRICAAAQAKFAKLPSFPLSNFDPFHPRAKQLPTVGRFFDQAARKALSASLDRQLVALGTPPANGPGWARLLRDRAANVRNGQRQIEVALAADVPGFVQTVRNAVAGYRRTLIDSGVFGAYACGTI